ncbi:MAG TPA: hypothetical protein VFG00_07970 [Acidothermaceae bacterium]|nr:hypothetical protein [Acidothermaceae bacterium]
MAASAETATEDTAVGAGDWGGVDTEAEVEVDERAEAAAVFVLLHPAKAAATVTATTMPATGGELRTLI